MNQFIRQSKQRDEILRVLMSTTCHPDADWIYQEVRKELPNISLGTVYRNLNALAENGTILELHTGHNMKRYDGNTSGHCHFVCEVCGEVTDIMENPNIDIALNGYDVSRVNIVMYGKCPKCNKIN